MSSVKNIFDVSGRAMAAQMIRLNTVASNLANSNNISSSSEGAYRPLKPIFKTQVLGAFSGIIYYKAILLEAKVLLIFLFLMCLE